MSPIYSGQPRAHSHWAWTQIVLTDWFHLVIVYLNCILFFQKIEKHALYKQPLQHGSHEIIQQLHEKPWGRDSDSVSGEEGVSALHIGQMRQQ